MEGMTKEIQEWIEDKKSPLKQAGARRALADIFLSLPTLQHEKRVEVFRALDKYKIPEIIPSLEHSELEKEMISAALFDERIKNDIFDLTKTDLEISICWAKCVPPLLAGRPPPGASAPPRTHWALRAAELALRLAAARDGQASTGWAEGSRKALIEILDTETNQTVLDLAAQLMRCLGLTVSGDSKVRTALYRLIERSPTHWDDTALPAGADAADLWMFINENNITSAHAHNVLTVSLLRLCGGQWVSPIPPTAQQCNEMRNKNRNMNDFSARNVCAEMKSKNEQDSLCSAESVEMKASSLNENRTNATLTAQTNVKVVPRLYGWGKWDYLNGTNEAELCLRLNRCCEFTKGWKEKHESKMKELGKDGESDESKVKQEGLNEMDKQNCSALNSVDGFVVGILTRLWIHAHGKVRKAIAEWLKILSDITSTMIRSYILLLCGEIDETISPSVLVQSLCALSNVFASVCEEEKKRQFSEDDDEFAEDDDRESKGKKESLHLSFSSDADSSTASSALFSEEELKTLRLDNQTLTFPLLNHLVEIIHTHLETITKIIPARVLFRPLLSYCTTVKHQISDSVNAAQDDIDEDALIKKQDSFNEVLDETLIAILGKLDTQDAKDAAEAIFTRCPRGDVCAAAARRADGVGEGKSG